MTPLHPCVASSSKLNRWGYWVCSFLAWCGLAWSTPPAPQDTVGPLLEQTLAWRDLAPGWAPPGTRFVNRFAEGVEGLNARGGASAEDPQLWRLALLCATFGDDRRKLREGLGSRLAAAGRALLDDLERGTGARPFGSWLLTDVVAAAPGGGGRSPDVVERELGLALALLRPSPGLKTALLTVARRKADPL